ncbi:MAG TPA: squalene/phytoene synthase family protein, partial [Burkholderiales bacterium]|nr:squalene/phytoene synthase family protein [Burkholderiales bacterium]
MKKHYENFPVASIALPARFRKPVGLVYAFARQADDFADEGERRNEERLALLAGFRSELEKISKGLDPETELFVELSEAIRRHGLPIQPFCDLLDAFSQDVVKKSYENFESLLDYCRKSANPVGRLLIVLYGIDSE